MTAHSLFLLPRFDTAFSPLRMPPLRISSMTSPVEGGDGGINIAAVEGDPAGVFCSINAYQSMQAGDRIDVHWGVDHKYLIEVQPDQVDEPLFFYLPRAFIVRGWVEVWYQLNRMGESVPDDPSISLRLLVKLDRPGGRDTRPHDPIGHSELKFVQFPPELDLVDAEWAINGVPMGIQTYPFIAAHDSITVQWGRIFLPPHLVTQEQAEGREPIIITADQATILAAGDSNALRVHYDVHDEVWNYAERYSQYTTVAVDAGTSRLEAPIIKESNNGIIDLEQLGKKDVTVQIHITTTDFEIDDSLIMTFIGTPNTGRPLVHTQQATLTNIPSILELPVPYAFMRAIAMGSADAFYVLNKKNNGPSLPSKHAFASVIGQITLLPEPVIREALGNTLEPVEPMATVDISYLGMVSGDYINLIWLGTRASGQPYLHEAQHTVTANEAKEKLVTMYVGGEHIRTLENGTLDLSYRVANDDTDVYGISHSEHALVRVESIRAELPVPIVLEADPPNILDPSKVHNFVTVLVDYRGMAKDDMLTCDWVGAGPGGSYRDSVPITAPTVGQPIRFRVDAQVVIANIGLYVKVRYALWRAATNRYSYSTTLNLLIGELVGELPPPEVIQAPGGNLDPAAGLGRRGRQSRLRKHEARTGHHCLAMVRHTRPRQLQRPGTAGARERQRAIPPARHRGRRQYWSLGVGRLRRGALWRPNPLTTSGHQGTDLSRPGNRTAPPPSAGGQRRCSRPDGDPGQRLDHRRRLALRRRPAKGLARGPWHTAHRNFICHRSTQRSGNIRRPSQ